VTPTNGEVELSGDDQHAVVDLTGGGLRSYSARGRDVLDGYPAGEASTSGRGQVLIPWPNRLEDGSYELDGKRHQLEVNEPERGNAIHGLVRFAKWSVAKRGENRAVVEHLLEPQPGFPFSLALSIEYSLSPSGLRVQTTAVNVGTERCPYGSGAHPYLTLGTENVDDAILRAPGRVVLQVDDRGLPRGAEPVEGTAYDFTRPRPIGSTRLDHAFTDLHRDQDGLARVALADPASRGSSLSLWVDESYPYLQLFTGDPLPDVARRSLAVEPMTCPANAFRTGEGLILLEPGESVTTTWGISPA
jgi:aldose 1-epimerase